MAPSITRSHVRIILAAALLVVVTAAGIGAAAPASAVDRSTARTGPFAYEPDNKRASATATTITLTATPFCHAAIRCELKVTGSTVSSRQPRPLVAGSQPWPSWVQPGEYLTVGFTTVAIGSNGGRMERTGVHPVILRPGPARTPLTATVRSIDHAARSAVIGGTATKGAQVLIGDRDTSADTTTGAWSITVAGLSVGTNSLTAIQKINGSEYDRRPVSVTVDPPKLDPVTVTGPATVSPGIENHFTGTATPGATFRVLDASGTPITPGRHAVDDDGQWEFATIVPAGVTTFSFVIEQRANGQTEPSELFTFEADTAR